MNLRKLFSARGGLSAMLVAACVLLIQSAVQAQTLTPATNPPSGLAGINESYLTGSGFPSGTPITGGTVTFAATCGGTAVTTGPVIQVAVEGPIRRFGFLIPKSLKTGTYYVSVAGSAGGTAFNSLNTPSCSTLQVTASTTTLAACVPTSSLAVTVGTNVNAFVPFGSWDEIGTTGIEEVPIEGSGTAQNFTTTGYVNSCASNSVTGEVVCTENSTNVDLINGTTLTTLSSGSNDYASFSGGSCNNCGVGINPVNNTAVIAMGYYGGSGTSGEGVQVLNLSSNTFDTPFAMANAVSEDISIDSSRNLILSPGEDYGYDLLKIGSGNALTEYANDIESSAGGGYYGYYLDSAAEDCTTGIAMSADEFTDDIYITDLTQATFTAGSPGTWTAPGQYFNLSDGGYAAGTSGISSAPGSDHLAVVTGEFGGSSFAALQLPSTSGSGTPTLTDYAYVSTMPATPDANSFSAGYDPHTVTAYTSPNTNKSYAVFVDWYPGHPDYLGVVDLACVLALPRTAPGSHTVSGSAASCVRYVAIP